MWQLEDGIVEPAVVIGCRVSVRMAGVWFVTGTVVPCADA